MSEVYWKVTTEVARVTKSKQKHMFKFDFHTSLLEVHNEEVYDLLAERNKVEVKIGSGSTIVSGLAVREITDPCDVSQFDVMTDFRSKIS